MSARRGRAVRRATHSETPGRPRIGTSSARWGIYRPNAAVGPVSIGGGATLARLRVLGARCREAMRMATFSVLLMRPVALRWRALSG
jgi:hypothetical protein